MQGIRKLRFLLESNADQEHFLFGVSDFAPVFPELSSDALKMLITRAAKDALLEPICRNVYLYAKSGFSRGFLLHHAAAKLRANTLNYISLESALSDAGVISQIPLQWITLMSGGRSAKIDCGTWGTIEFVHTAKRPEILANELSYDTRCGLWRASVKLAIADMRAARRPFDLVDRSVVDELV